MSKTTTCEICNVSSINFSKKRFFNAKNSVIYNKYLLLKTTTFNFSYYSKVVWKDEDDDAKMFNYCTFFTFQLKFRGNHIGNIQKDIKFTLLQIHYKMCVIVCNCVFYCTCPYTRMLSEKNTILSFV